MFCNYFDEKYLHIMGKVIPLADYNEDELIAILNDEQKHTEQVERDLQLAEFKTKEICERIAKEIRMQQMLEKIAQVKCK